MGITIPCDYRSDEGCQCKEGQVSVWGAATTPRPDQVTCPKCSGSGKIKVEKSVIEKQIADLVKEQVRIEQELVRLRQIIIQDWLDSGS